MSKMSPWHFLFRKRKHFEVECEVGSNGFLCSIWSVQNTFRISVVFSAIQQYHWPAILNQACLQGVYKKVHPLASCQYQSEWPIVLWYSPQHIYTTVRPPIHFAFVQLWDVLLCPAHREFVFLFWLCVCMNVHVSVPVWPSTTHYGFQTILTHNIFWTIKLNLVHV